MCMICVDWQRGNLTLQEAKRNLSEMTELDPEHVQEVLFMLDDSDEEDD